jgi:protease-4
MKQFLKFTLATIVGFILSLLLVFLIFAGMVAGLMPKQEVAVVKPNSVLQISLDKVIVDRSSANPFENLDFQTMESNKALGLNDILANIKKAANDPNIEGILLRVESADAGLATIDEIRNALVEFKKSKKFINAYAENLSQKAYFLCSVADSVFVHPEGMLEFQGISYNAMFFKGALEKLGIEPEIIRHGKFKSAVEPFILEKMSPENREQVKTFVGSMWNHMLTRIAESRKLSINQLNLIADSLLITNPAKGVELKMIDGLKYWDEVSLMLKKRTGQKEKESLRIVELDDYNTVPEKKTSKGLEKNKIAVVYASGEIKSGKGGEQEIGSETLAKAISEARSDSSVKAIVLRVNSPGGSALASDVIWREMVLARKVKPVVVSMGDVAASGGYYISCPADEVFASPTTLTGSIGVFGLFFNAGKLMSEKLGITSDVVNTNSNSDIMNPLRKMKPSEKAIIQREIERIYETFITHVSEGRKMPKVKVDDIGQGRVWSGENALANGLIDKFGGLNDAIAAAAKRAKIEKYRVTELPRQKDFFEQILNDLAKSTKAGIVQNELGDAYPVYQQFNSLIHSNGIQARLPFYFEVN